jgi:hypothetical protein
MLPPDDRRRFNQIVERLYAEDPAFAARVASTAQRRLPMGALVLIVLACVAALLFLVVGGWAGLPAAVMSVAAALTTVYVHSRRTRGDRNR